MEYLRMGGWSTDGRQDGSEVKTTSVEKMYRFFIFLIVCYASMNVCIHIKEKK